jgi:hypothetical protein
MQKAHLVGPAVLCMVRHAGLHLGERSCLLYPAAPSCQMLMHKSILQADRMADALVIASVGGSYLLEKAQKEYMRRAPRPYMKIVSAITNRDLTGAEPLPPFRDSQRPARMPMFDCRERHCMSKRSQAACMLQ